MSTPTPSAVGALPDTPVTAIGLSTVDRSGMATSVWFSNRGPGCGVVAVDSVQIAYAMASLLRCGAVTLMLAVLSQDAWLQRSKACPAVPPHLAAWALVLVTSAPVNSPPVGMPALAKAAWSDRPPTEVSSVGTPLAANGASSTCCSSIEPAGCPLLEYTK